jgi:hypothetical protein
VLPGFAVWLVEEVERLRPDCLVPAETKGARLLETVLGYARDILGTPIDVPVLYGTALPFVGREKLRGSRILILDDAVQTGSTLDLHRKRLEAYGAIDVKAVACIAGADVERVRSEVDSYVTLNRGLYDEYVWQLTDLVVARGLPPEVDHLVFEVRLPERLAAAWPALMALLARHGTLTVDGPAERRQEPTGMTLHFPDLPGSARVGDDGTQDGARKLRFFPDPANDRVFVVPVSFPALRVPASAPDSLSPGAALELIESTMGHAGSLGALLVAEAETLDNETIFRALSACMEVDMVASLAQELGRVFPEGVSIACQDELVRRLYGPDASGPVAGVLADEIAKGLAEGRTGDTAEGVTADQPPTLYLDHGIAEATRSVARGLKRLYDEHSDEQGRDSTRRLGMALHEIAETLDGDTLLASRCVDYGLALTALVPYVDDDPLEDGSILMRRKYRVSEPNRGRGAPYSDVEMVEREVSEEALVLIAVRAKAVMGGAAISGDAIASLVAILEPLVLEEHAIQLCARPGLQGHEILLSDRNLPVPLDDASPLYTVLDDGGIVPTTRFTTLDRENRLKLDVRKCAEVIEDHIDDVAPVVLADGAEALRQAWGMTADRCLGLSHVRHSLDAALSEMETPLKLVLRGVAHESSSGVAGRANKATAAALTQLSLLADDWSAPARERWSRPNEPRRSKRLLAGLLAPRGTTTVYDFSRSLATLVSALGTLVERLDAASAREWIESGTAGGAAGDTLLWCARIRRALTSLKTDDGSLPETPADARDAITLAAEDLLDVLDRLRAFTGALAGDYRGPDHVVAADQQDERDGTTLSIDIAGSSRHGNTHEPQANKEWQEDGLNRAAQWARAFGGEERRPRKGDELWAEFDAGADGAMLAAAAIQQHADALRATAVDELTWRYHAAVDHGRMHASTVDNTIARCLNTSSKLAKACDRDGESGGVFTIRETLDRCSPALREDGDIVAALERQPLDGKEIEPLRLDAAALIAKLAAGVQALGERIVAETPAIEVEDPRVGETAAADDGIGSSDAATS